jgi:hypothetical protein
MVNLIVPVVLDFYRASAITERSDVPRENLEDFEQVGAEHRTLALLEARMPQNVFSQGACWSHRYGRTSIRRPQAKFQPIG